MKFPHYSTLYRLTQREQEVAELVAEGLTNREIAQILVISPKTVENHVDRILSKFGVDNRRQVMLLVLRRKLLQEMKTIPHDCAGCSCLNGYTFLFERRKDHV